MQRLIITGGLSRDPEVRPVNDTQVCVVSLGVTQGWGDNKTTNWFRCNVWGKRASTVAEHLRKGMKATVIGELSIGEYNGKPQYDVRVDDIDWTSVRRDDARQPDSRPPVDDLADDVPW